MKRTSIRVAIWGGLSLALSACATPSAPPGEPVDNRLVLALPDLEWAVEIRSPGFEVRKRAVQPRERRASFQAAHEKTGVTVSAFLLPSSGKDAKAWRNGEWPSKRREGLNNFLTAELDDAAIVWYRLDFPDLNARALHSHIYRTKDGMAVEVHISKLPFKDGDEAEFERLFGAIRFLEPYNYEAWEGIKVGSYYYQRRDLRSAIVHYGKALEREKKRRTLPRDLWRVLVDNLGMAYGISGDLARAKETFEYGLSVEPTYPMFHYNMACTYAEMSQLDPALESLRNAYQHRGNMMEGEKVPDPARDSSFKRFVNDPKFQAVVKELEALPPR
jgi:tetratricopeptide (TPR) repeat protein